MDAFLSPNVLFAVGTAFIGVALFGLAPVLPSLFPRWFTRMMGFGVAVLALGTLWLLTWSWQATALLGGLALAAMLIIGAAQGCRRTPAPAGEETETPPADVAATDPPERTES